MTHNPMGKAIDESNTAIAMARAETRKRRWWGYIREDTLRDWAEKQQWPDNVIPATDVNLARKFFNVKETAPAYVGKQGDEHNVFAVWRRLDEPTTEPDFYDPKDDVEAVEGKDGDGV